MTNVYFEADGPRRILSARGHATYEGPTHDAEHRVGRGGAAERADIRRIAGWSKAELVPTKVCAAVSGILYALAGYLQNAQEWGKAEVFTCRMDSGDVVLDAAGGEGVEAAFLAAVIGLLQLQKRYPELVKVEARDR